MLPLNAKFECKSFISTPVLLGFWFYVLNYKSIRVSVQSKCSVSNIHDSSITMTTLLVPVLHVGAERIAFRGPLMPKLIWALITKSFIQFSNPQVDVSSNNVINRQTQKFHDFHLLVSPTYRKESQWIHSFSNYFTKNEQLWRMCWKSEDLITCYWNIYLLSVMSDFGKTVL